MKHIKTGIDKILGNLIESKQEARVRLAAEKAVDKMVDALSALDDVIQMQTGICLPQNSQQARDVLRSLWESKHSKAQRRHGDLPVDKWDFAEPAWLEKLSDAEVKQQLVIRNALIKAVKINHEEEAA